MHGTKLAEKSALICCSLHPVIFPPAPHLCCLNVISIKQAADDDKAVLPSDLWGGREEKVICKPSATWSEMLGACL